MNLLILTMHKLKPNTDGYTVRMYNLLKNLKLLGHNITLMTFCSKEEEKIIKENNITEICNKFIPIPINRKLSYFREIKAIFTGRPFKMEYYNSTKAKNIIKEEVNNNDYDYIGGYWYASSLFLDMFPNKKRWLDLCDAISLLYKRRINTTKNIFEKIILSIERDRVLKIEKKCIRNYDLITMISEVDKRELNKFIDTKDISIIKNAVEGNKPTGSITHNPLELCFLGDLSYIQNHEAAMYIVKEILPALNKLNPNISVKIIGKKPQKKLEKISKNNPNVKLTGFVENLAKELQGTNAMICPIKISSGLQNKVIEAMYYGLPVITTSQVAKPITENPNLLLQANTIEEWQKQIFYLIEDQNKRNEISKNAQNYITENFNWGKITKKLERDLLND